MPGLFPAAALYLLFAGATVLWISLDRFPPNWDDAWYLTKSLAVYDAAMERGVAGYLSALGEAFGFKAPLIAGLPFPFYVIFGRRWHAAYLVNLAAMLVLFAALYRIGCRCWSGRVGIMAVAAAGSMPLLYGLARWYLADYALAAAVAGAMAILAESGSLRRPGWTLLFGAICGLGLMLKAGFGLFLLPAGLYAWLACPRRARAAALVGIPCLAIALPWYAGHWRPVLENALDAGYGTPALVQGTGPIFSARTILIYAGNVARSGISEYFAALAGVLIVLSPSRLMDPSFRFVLLWMLPIVIFVFGGNKDVRYIAPVLPGVALLIAALLDSKLPRHRWGTVAGVLVFVFPVLSLLAVSFGVPWRAEGRGYARVYDPRPWPQEEMLRLAAAYAAPGQVPRPLLLAGSDRAGFNANNLELTAAALRLPLRIESTAHEASAAVLLDRLDEAEFFLYKEGGEPESEVFNPHFAALAERVRSGGDFVEIPYGKTLPDGGRARLFRRSPRAATAEPREEFVIPFGAEMALTSMRVEQSAGLVRVHYVWRQLAKLPRQYWSFTHLVDASDRIVAQSDRVVAGEPGRARQQEIRIPLPGDAARAGLRIRFGLYHPPEGVRLRPGSVPPGLALGIAPADHGTALVLAFR